MSPLSPRSLDSERFMPSESFMSLSQESDSSPRRPLDSFCFLSLSERNMIPPELVYGEQQ